MSDPFDPRPARGFQDLVPWADPYIVSLIEKLRRSAEAAHCDSRLRADLPPRPVGPDGEPDDAWPGDWRPRNWPSP